MLKSTCKAIMFTALVGTSTSQVFASTTPIEPATLTPATHLVAAHAHASLSYELESFFQKLPTEFHDAWQKVITAFDKVKAAAPTIEADATAVLNIATTIAALDGNTAVVADLNKAQAVVTGAGTVITSDSITSAVTAAEATATIVAPSAATAKIITEVNADITKGTTIVNTLEPVVEPLVNSLITPPTPSATNS
ncbi:MAG: hypothetical protein V4482_02690 [Pseudomonadota bacterium]